MLKQYGDTLVQHVDNQAADEFEAATYHKAGTVGQYTSLLGAELAGAVLAWALPGQDSLWSAAVLIVPVIGGFASSQWMRNYVAAPAAQLMPRTPLIIYLLLCVVWVAGLVVNGGFSGESGSSAATGAIVGAIAAAVLVGPFTRWRRKQDRKRLDAQLDE